RAHEEEPDADQEPCGEADVAQPARRCEDTSQLRRVDLDELVRSGRPLGATAVVPSQPPSHQAVASSRSRASRYESWPSSASHLRKCAGIDSAPTTGSSGSSHSVGTSANGNDWAPPIP